MKVAITGHTRGIGLGFYNYFSQESNHCLGFSRSNGYDITNINHRYSILSQVANFDIFVNNAYSNFDDSQLEMLKLIYYNWLSKDRIIINISTRATDFKVDEEPLKTYVQSKHKLDLFCLGKNKDPWVINLKPGLTDTDRVKDVVGKPRIKVNDIIKVCDFILKNSDSFKITTLTFGI